MSSYSDSDSDSCASTDSSPSRRGFVALIVSGPNAVAQFEASFPTQYKRCHLARLIGLGRPTGAPYSIKLEQHYDWRVGCDFDSFIQQVIPESLRSDLAVYDVSDWDHYDYWNATSSTTTGADIAVSVESSPESVQFDTQEHDSPLPKRSRPLDSLTQRSFSLGGSRSAHSSPMKTKVLSAKRPWPRLSSQQTSPMLQPMETSAEANKIPRDLTLLATDAPSTIDA